MHNRAISTWLLGLSIAFGFATRAVANDAMFDDAFATVTDTNHQASVPAGDERGDRDIAENLLKLFEPVSSFPARMVYGDEDQDSWDGLAESATKPKRLEQWYTANNCRFALVADTFAINVKYARPRQIKPRESLGPQNILLVTGKKLSALTISTELRVQIAAGSEKFCRKTFAGKSIRFANLSLRGGHLFLENRAGARVVFAEPSDVTTNLIYLKWDEDKDTLVVSDRAGVVCGVETGTYAVPTAKQGIYYLNFEPAWTIERVTGPLAVNSLSALKGLVTKSP